MRSLVFHVFFTKAVFLRKYALNLFLKRVSSALGIFVFYGALNVQAANVNVPPAAQNISLTLKFDKASVPQDFYIWNKEFGGSTVPICGDAGACENQDILNSLICYSESDTTKGACPTKLIWLSPIPSNTLRLAFTNEKNVTRILSLTATKNNNNRASWFAGTQNQGFTVKIPDQELRKLDSGGKWSAHLMMKVEAWKNCVENTTTGCVGTPRVDWNANITITVTDLGTQQIYFPAFPKAAPRISLNLNNRPGVGNNTTLAGTNTLDMCLYDGSNSSSNRISLLFQDEGGSATGRTSGQFSVYREGGDKTQEANRIDYQVSVINPTTGTPQAVSNGTEIIWANTNARNIQRQVVLPGVPGISQCVPAPLTLTTPAFIMANKTAGHFTGRLRVIYTPTTQTSQ
ncbi:CfaE/CblD family pilus tip adhesin [Serratia liquefaciens]|uniref:CfaE/CblD family pilus tip adhesin n=1 Tax=Serratia liquefaciens TaxID=614 RepID=UPI0023610B01|nr:CfaE/CblD family pilus tip adhesin [Serratia liquefaciens]